MSAPHDLGGVVRDQIAAARECSDNLAAALAGWVMPDGRPITEHTIGALMAEYEDEVRKSVYTTWLDPELPS